MFDRFIRLAAVSVPLLLVQPALAKDPVPKDPVAKDTGAKDLGAKDPGAKDPGAKTPGAKAPAATEAQAPDNPAAKQPSAGQTAVRDRQKACGAEWRGLTDVQKAAQGPKWPQYWSKCNKRRKGDDKA